jgi:hypothetical protein
MAPWHLSIPLSVTDQYCWVSNPIGALDGLRAFFAKHGAAMTDEERAHFFERAARLFGAERSHFEGVR